MPYGICGSCWNKCVGTTMPRPYPEHSHDPSNNGDPNDSYDGCACPGPHIQASVPSSGAHVVMDTSVAGQGGFACLNCGAKHALAYPISIDMMIVNSDGFTRLHKDCKPQPNPVAERFDKVNSLDPMTPDQWINSADTGQSAVSIWVALSNRLFPPNQQEATIPYDPSDFGRCYRLLKRITGWRERLPEVAVKFPLWKPYVEAWTALEALYEEELPTGSGPKLLAALQKLRA